MKDVSNPLDFYRVKWRCHGIQRPIPVQNSSAQRRRDERRDSSARRARINANGVASGLQPLRLWLKAKWTASRMHAQATSQRGLSAKRAGRGLNNRSAYVLSAQLGGRPRGRRRSKREVHHSAGHAIMCSILSTPPQPKMQGASRRIPKRLEVHHPRRSVLSTVVERCACPAWEMLDNLDRHNSTAPSVARSNHLRVRVPM